MEKIPLDEAAKTGILFNESHTGNRNAEKDLQPVLFVAGWHLPITLKELQVRQKICNVMPSKAADNFRIIQGHT